MRLFDLNKLKKFYDILNRMGRDSCNDRYKGHYKKDSDFPHCEKEIFVHRTINKWFKDKYLVYYNPKGIIEFKQYFLIVSIDFKYNWALDNLTVYLFDFSNPQKGIYPQIIKHNDVVDAEGRWPKDDSLHVSISQLYFIDEPKMEYIFKAFDLSAKGKRGRLKETTFSVQAKTLNEAYKLKDKNKDSNIMIGEFLETKEINE